MVYFYIKEGVEDNKLKYISGTLLPILDIHEHS